jgi:hypothetical protein
MGATAVDVWGQARCPRQPGCYLFNQDTGELRASRCDAVRCTFCGPRLAREAPSLIAAMQPQRAVTLTLAPADWQRRRGQLRDYVRRIRETGATWEMAWSTERNPSRPDLRHVHAAQWGDYVPQATLQDLWGGRIVDVRAIRGTGWSSYISKEALAWASYVTKDGRDQDQTDDHQDEYDYLTDNGGRLFHATRGYWRGSTQTEVRRTLRANARVEDGTWRLVRLSDVEARYLHQGGDPGRVSEILAARLPATSPQPSSS